MPSSSKRTAILYLSLVFAAGVALGAAAYHFASSSGVREVQVPPSPKQFRETMVRHHTELLGLSETQLAQYDAILDEVEQRYDEVWAKVGPEFEKVRQKRRQMFMKILTPEQQETYAKHLADRPHRRNEPQEKKKGPAGLPPLSQPQR